MSSQGDSQPSQDSTMTLMQDNLHEVLYFAYGSNLSTEQMRQRCPYSTPVGLAYLEGWKWIINARGYANIVQLPLDDNEDETDKGKGKAVDDEEHGVYGLLYLLPPQDEERLDQHEGVPWAYQKFQVNVKWAHSKDSEETLRALVYVDGQRVEEDVPRDEYVGRMERGIEDAVDNWGLDEEWADRTMRRFWRASRHLGSTTKTTSHDARRSIITTTPRLARSFPAWFARGGTSNGLVIHRRDLPPEAQWSGVLPPAMGSPDSYGRQLNGMGSGLSSTSKIVILGPPSRPDVHVDFTFVQVGIKDGVLDMAGNCGNMSSLVGPAAWDARLVPAEAVEQEKDGSQWVTVRFLNTNTNKVMTSRFQVAGEPLRYTHEGDYVMDGVPGKGSKVIMSFLDPAGAKTGKALPTGNPVDVLELPDGSKVEASLVDVGNPGVFISTESLGLANHMSLTPAIVEADADLKVRLEQIRRAGTSLMGLDPNIESVPKIVLLFPTSGSAEVDIRCLALSMGQAHKAVPLTLALCLGAASQIKGTIASGLIGGKSRETVTIGHPTGKVDIGTVIRDDKIESAQLLRTARFIMKGDDQFHQLPLFDFQFLLLEQWLTSPSRSRARPIHTSPPAPHPLRAIDRFAAAWFALCDVETITALAWGPLCLFTVAGIIHGSRSRHVAQVIVCTAHAYGVALYYLTNFNESRMHGVAYSRPETLYFWIYYVGFNFPWAVVPLVLLRDSWRQIGSAFAALEEKRKGE
ncbi:hypothetical protein LRP88_06866 [Fusarium phalaenopsidis]